ncbi:MAG TPA: cupin domain-containing protein [Gaiellaceae bacterium]|nr:cupin domain-containing protein [Gaiellaceae bacterium]
MSGYTIKNLKQVDDSATQFGLSPNLEARFARKPLDGKNAGLSYQRLAPGFRVPFGHTHETQEEIYVVVSGSGRLKLDDEVVDVQQWDAIRVAPRTMRNWEAGPDGLEFVAFGAGRAGDAEMTQDWWSD